MALVFTRDHEEDGVKYHAGNECPRGFPHPRKRQLVIEGVLVDESTIIQADKESTVTVVPFED